MGSARISVYSDAKVHYDGVVYPDVAALLVPSAALIVMVAKAI